MRLRARREVCIEQQRRDRGLVPLGMEMVLCRGKNVEPGLLGEHHKLPHFVQHLLIALVVAANGTQPLALFEGSGHGGKDKQHELHGHPPATPTLRVLPHIDAEALMLGRWQEGVKRCGGWTNSGCMRRLFMAP